jgi:hypothetical protein
MVQFVGLKRQLVAARGRGQPLDPGVRRALESSFDLDLSAIRIHTGPAAAELARDLDAAAFASGGDIFFAEGMYRPGLADGLRLLAHEIAHAVQQGRGAVRAPAGRLVLGRRGDRWEAEAECVAGQVLAGRPVTWGGAGGRLAEAAPLGAGLHRGVGRLEGVVTVAAAGEAQGEGGLVVQCHDSFEHRILGDLNWYEVVRLVGNTGADVLQDHLELLDKWSQSPESVSEADIAAKCPDIRTIRLQNGLLVTYGELNALPDYIATPAMADTLPKDTLLPILQYIRNEGYNRLSQIVKKPGKTFECVPSSAMSNKLSVWGDNPFMIWVKDQLLGALATKYYGNKWLDDLTASLGTNHYGALLARNACHFAPYSWYRWQAAYVFARGRAQQAHDAKDPSTQAKLTHDAWIYAGYADHFLQDSFAAGHLINKNLIMQWFVEWAAQSNPPGFGVPDWNALQYMTTSLQPNLAGRKLYDTTYSGISDDPQTAEDLPNYGQRVAATGLVPVSGNDLDTTYQNYLTFLSSIVTQFASAEIHDYYNTKSLRVASAAHKDPFVIYGDNTLLTAAGQDGAGMTSKAAQASQQSIADLLKNGQTGIQVADIQKQFPTEVVGNDGSRLTLQQWNDTQKQVCWNDIFPPYFGSVKRVAGGTLGSIGQVSKDLGVKTFGWNNPASLKRLAAVQQGGSRGNQLWGIDLGGRLHSTFQTSPSGGWTGWTGRWNDNAPENLVDVAVALQNDGRVQLWALTADNRLFSTYQTSPGGSWSEWAVNWNNAPNLRAIAAVQQGGTAGARFWGVDWNGQVRSCYQVGDRWTDWSGTYGMNPWSTNCPDDAIDITATQLDDGRVQVWVLTANNVLYSNVQDTAGGDYPASGWQGHWNSSPQLRTITAPGRSKGRAAMFWGVDLNGSLYCSEQRGPGSNWMAWSPNWLRFLYGAVDIAAAQQVDGRYQFWAVGPDSKLYCTWETQAGNWSGWSPALPV